MADNGVLTPRGIRVTPFKTKNINPACEVKGPGINPHSFPSLTSTRIIIQMTVF